MKRRMRRLWCSLVCVLGLVASGACGAGRDHSIGLMAADIDAYVTALTSEGLFSGVVLTVFEGELVIEQGYGWADLEGGVRNQPRTKFRISSLTKAFTALAIMRLQEQGRLRVEDRICSYLEPCPDRWGQVTIHHLLSHTSGIPDYVAESGFWQTTARHRATVEEIIGLVADLPLTGAPGAQFGYSSTGYVLLGHIIARLADPSAPAPVAYLGYLEQQIFGPLRMGETGSEECEPNVVGVAVGYASLERRAEPCDASAFFAMGDLYSTAPDLRRWAQALDDETLLPSPARATLFAAHTATGQYQTSYGYGWYITEIGGVRRIWHDGVSPGFRSFLQRELGAETVIIILSNDEAAPVVAMGREIAAVLIRRAKDAGP
jgi:CubicO group peptidase (beta-lactamase class C family)